MNRLAVLIFVAIFSISCGSLPFRLDPQEEALGTQKRANWRYHRLAEEIYGFGLRYPGYVLGFEKTSREKYLGLPKFRADSAPWRAEPAIQDLQLAADLENWLSDSRQAFLSHVVRYSYSQERGSGTIRPGVLFSVYTSETAERLCGTMPCPKLYDYGIDLLENRVELSEDEPIRSDLPQGSQALGDWIRQDVERMKITHVILYSMGWNTDQQEALRNFNSLVGPLLTVSEFQCPLKSRVFNPLVIAVTWDSLAGSRWIRPFTYPFKAADADEIGVNWISRLLHQTLLPIRRENPDLRLVVVGHSFGARVLSRAIFTPPFGAVIAEGEASPGDDSLETGNVDLFLGLQGAFSVNRFVEGHSSEGAPYRDFKNTVGSVALTWSEHDSANPWAFWTGLAGGTPGYEETRKYPKLFAQNAWKCFAGGNCRWDDPPPEGPGGRVLMIDVSDIAKHATHNKGGGAHSDIYTYDMARLVADLIERYASTPAQEPCGDPSRVPGTSS